METPIIVGAKYRVIEDDIFFKKGAEVTLVYDNGGYRPWFSGPIVSGFGHWVTPNGLAKEGDPGAVRCEPCHMSHLELIEAPKDLDAEIEALRKEVAELKERLVQKEPLEIGDRVRVDLPSLEGRIIGDSSDGTYEVTVDGFHDSELAWLEPKRLTRIK